MVISDLFHGVSAWRATFNRVPWESMQGMGGHSRAGVREGHPSEGGPSAETYVIQMLQRKRTGGRAARAEGAEDTKSEEEGAWWMRGRGKRQVGMRRNAETERGRQCRASKATAREGWCSGKGHIPKTFAGVLPAPTSTGTPEALCCTYLIYMYPIRPRPHRIL